MTNRKRALLAEWNDADRALKVHQQAHPVCAFPMQRWGCPDWRRLNDVVDTIETQMLDLRMPHPNNITEDDLDD